MNAGTFNVVSEVSQIVLISFHSVFFILLHGSDPTVLSSTSLIQFPASVVLLLLPSSVVFILITVLFTSVL